MKEKNKPRKRTLRVSGLAIYCNGTTVSIQIEQQQRKHQKHAMERQPNACLNHKKNEPFYWDKKINVQSSRFGHSIAPIFAHW